MDAPAKQRHGTPGSHVTAHPPRRKSPGGGQDSAPRVDAFRTMPGHLIRRAHQVSTALFAEECGAFDITAVQFAALSAIRDAADLDATRLAARIAFDRSTIGDVLERLETKGWIVRVTSVRDRRVKQLALSEAGASLLVQIASAVQRVQARLLAPFPADQRAAVLDMLRLLSA